MSGSHTVDRGPSGVPAGEQGVPASHGSGAALRPAEQLSEPLGEPAGVGPPRAGGAGPAAEQPRAEPPEAGRAAATPSPTRPRRFGSAKNRK